MLAAAALLTTLAVPADADPPVVGSDTVAYTVSPVIRDGALTALAVEVRFAGDADGETRLVLPDQGGEGNEQWRHLEDVAVDGAAVREDGPAARVLTHAPGAALAVRYRVRSAYEADPGFGFDKSRPLLLPGWFLFHGESVFAEPENHASAPARFAWRGFPAAWKVASDLDHLAARPGTVREIMESVSIGAPDLTLIERTVDGAPLRFAVHGSWRFTSDAFADRVGRIIAGSDAVWGDPARPYLVVLASLGGTGAGVSASGTGRGDAFSVASTPGLELDFATRLLAHEYLHTWIAGELGGLPVQDEVGGYWFSEGFTDFLAPRVLLHTGLWTPAQYMDEMNRTLLRHATSPARGATGADVRERFWTDRAVQQLPYDRGHLLAHRLEPRIRAATGERMGVLDVLRAQRERARSNAATGIVVPAHTLFLDVLRETTGVDAAAEVAAHVERGAPLLLGAETFGSCAAVATVTQPEYDRGFDLAATERAGGVLSGVDPASAAHAAGLRDGMRIVRREAGSIGDSAVELAYRVQDGTGERVIRYLPRGRGLVTFQRVTPAPGVSAAECARGMGVDGAGAPPPLK